VNYLVTQFEAGHAPDESSYQVELAETIAMLQAQIASGRADDCWALADLGVCYLLALETKSAKRVYSEMQSKCPPAVVDSSLSVLTSVATAMENLGDRRARAFAEMIANFGGKRIC